MTNKKFIRYQLKCWLPLFIVSLAMMAIIFWIDVASMSITDRYYNQPYDYHYTYGGTAILSSIIPAMVLTLVYPLSIFDYRFTKKGADTFLQLPLKEKQLKRTRLNLSLGMLLVAYTITFWIGVLLLVIRVNSYTPIENTGNIVYQLTNYNFLGYLLTYLLTLVFLAAEFYTNAFLAQLGNTVNTASTYIMMGQGILLLIEYSFHSYIHTGLLGELYYYGEGVLQPATFSLGTPVYLIYNLLEGFTVGGASAPGFASLALNEWFNFFVPLVVGIAAAVALYALPDPSGEYYGKPEPRNRAISMIPHAFFFLVGLLIFRVGNIPSVVMVYLMFALFYYMCLVGIYRSFRIKKRELVTMLCVCGALLILNIIPFIVLMGSDNYYYY